LNNVLQFPSPKLRSSDAAAIDTIAQGLLGTIPGGTSRQNATIALLGALFSIVAECYEEPLRKEIMRIIERTVPKLLTEADRVAAS
jgi:hypothetical protein